MSSRYFPPLSSATGVPRYPPALSTPQTPDGTPLPSEAGLFLPFPQGRRWVALAQIIRFEGASNYTYCHFVDAPPLLVALSLKILAGRLPGRALVRPHRKHLLNPLYVQAVSSARSEVLLTTGERFPVARRRVATFRVACRFYSPP